MRMATQSSYLMNMCAESCLKRIRQYAASNTSTFTARANSTKAQWQAWHSTSTTKC